MVHYRAEGNAIFGKVAMHNRTPLGMPVTAEQKLTVLPEA